MKRDVIFILFIFKVAVASIILFLLPLSATSYVLEKTERGIPLKWNISPGDKIGYSVNLNSCSDVADKDLLLKAVINSFNAWENVEGSYVAFQYKGDVTLTSIGVEKPCYDNPSKTCVYPDGVSLLVWLQKWPYDHSIIGLTTNWYYTDTGEIISSDIEFNDQDYTWRIISDPSSCDPHTDTDVVDAQNIITHEAGHFIGLDHTPVETATMYDSSPPCETSKRSLDQDDIDGVIFLYPEAGQPKISNVEAKTDSSSGELILDVYGSNFIDGAQVYLSKENSTIGALPARNTNFLSSSHLVANFSLSVIEEKNMWGYLTVIVEQTNGSVQQHAYLPEGVYIEKGGVKSGGSQENSTTGWCAFYRGSRINPITGSKPWLLALFVLFLLKLRVNKRREV